MQLKDVNWCKFAQDFQGVVNTGVLSITYLVTPDFAPSTNTDDYTNIPYKLSFDGWKPFNLDPGEWVAFITDTGTSRGVYWKIKAKNGSGPQTVIVKLKGLTTTSDKTLMVGFPPGKGAVVLLNVSLKPK